MEMTRLEDLASAATLDHWPPHLLAPNEDKVYALGAALKAATERIWELESVVDTNKALEEENGFLKSDIEDLKDTFKQVQEMIRRHVPTE